MGITAYSVVNVTCRFAVILEDLTHHQLVFAHPERVAVQGHGVEVHVRVGALGLVGARAVIVPDRAF